MTQNLAFDTSKTFRIDTEATLDTEVIHRYQNIHRPKLQNCHKMKNGHEMVIRGSKIGIEVINNKKPITRNQ